MKEFWRSAVMDTAILLLCGALILTVTFGVLDRRLTVSTAAVPYIVIDAGHGGADGGASAKDGTPEKSINLAVALPLSDILTVMGYRVENTRTDDRMLHTEGDSLRERKVSDMKQRLQLANGADLTVSIHQNHFSQAQYSGAQIFYSANTPDSRVLAESIRTHVVSMLQPTNTRELKKGTADVYLLHRATRPAVLVECGFLSNQAELEKLKNTDYQRQLSFAIAAGVMVYLG